MGSGHKRPRFCSRGREWHDFYDSTPKWLLAEMVYNYAMAAHGEEEEWEADEALQLSALRHEAELVRGSSNQ